MDARIKKMRKGDKEWICIFTEGYFELVNGMKLTPSTPCKYGSYSFPNMI
jgi:hypothetical protein